MIKIKGNNEGFVRQHRDKTKINLKILDFKQKNSEENLK